jgi:hypothetical protein
MKSSRRRIAFALTAAVPLVSPSPALAVQNWFGYGGVFGPQTNYTFYAPQAVSAGYAPQPVASFSVPAGLGEQVIVSTSPVVMPAVSYSPVTTFAPVTSCRPVVSYSPTTCGTTCGTVCGPTTFVAPPASVAPVIVSPPAATIVPAAPPITTPVYPPPGVYPPATSVPFPPTRTPEMPTSSTTSPADQPPTLSGFAPIDGAAPMQTPYNTAPMNAAPMNAAPVNTVPADAASAYTSPLNGATTTTPSNVAPPSGYTSGGAVTDPSGAKVTTPEKSDASQAPRIDRLKPDLDISVPEEDETMTPVAPTEKQLKIEAEPTNKPADEAEVGPRLDVEDDEHTASRGMKRAGLLAPATWRAVRTASKRPAAKRTETVWRAVKP